MKRVRIRPRTGRPVGRPPGSQNKVTKAIQAAVRANGKLPAQLLAEWAQTGLMEFVDEDGVKRTEELNADQRIECAGKAAPFFSAKKVAVGGDPDAPAIGVRDMSIRERFAKRIDGIASRMAIGVATSRELH